MARRSVLGFVLAIGIPVVAATALYFGTRPTCACEPIPASPVDGVVVQVDATGLTDISGFDLRTPLYPVYLHFILGPLENATQFSPGHLKAHQASASPVRVYFVRNGQDLVVYRLEDAPLPSTSP